MAVIADGKAVGKAIPAELATRVLRWEDDDLAFVQQPECGIVDDSAQAVGRFPSVPSTKPFYRMWGQPP